MAIRTIREWGDPVLLKNSKYVNRINQRTFTLIEDMFETMYEIGGVGLAAVQVGVLKRIVVIDAGEGPILLINPKVLETEGEQVGDEGCLSVPGKVGQVTRPEIVKVSAFDVNMEPIEIQGEGLLARALCHEIDHLEGKMYLDLVEGELRDAVMVSPGEDEDDEEDVEEIEEAEEAEEAKEE